jgi:outer membrane receptor protein involved in Fe transport
VSEHNLKSRLLTTSVFAGAVFAAAAYMPAVAQDADDDVVQITSETADEEAVQERILVTGSRLAGSNYAEISPVTTVGAEQIDLSGSLSVESLLNDLPQVIPGNTVTSNNAGGEDFATIDLRGLGATRTLVLINGERVPPSSVSGAVDLNTIPAGLIERVDVVTGGASAVYGSDAISGVVNFILKDDYEGGEITVRRGATTDGQLAGSEIVTGLFGGNFDDGRGNATMFVQYSNQDGVLQREFDYSRVSAALMYGYDYDTGYMNGAYVVDTLGEFTNAYDKIIGDGALPVIYGGGSGTPPWGTIALGATNAANGLSTNPATSGAFASVDHDCNPDTPNITVDSASSLSFDANGNLSPLLGAGYVVGNPNACTMPLRESGSSRYNYAPDNYIYLPSERTGIYSTLTYDLTDTIEMKALLSYQQSETQVQLAATPVTGIAVSPTSAAIVGADGIIGTADDPHPDLSAALLSRTDPTADFSMAWRSLALGPRTAEYKNHSLLGRLSFNGDLSERYDWNLSFGYGKVNFDSIQRNNTNTVALAQGLAGCDNVDPLFLLPNCVDVDIFGPNTTTPAMQDFLRTDIQTQNTLEQTAISGFIRGDVFELPAGWLTGVVGLEYRSQDVRRVNDDAQRRGEIAGFNAAQNIAGNIDVYEAYTEVGVPLVSDQTFVDDLSLELGYRVSDYSSVGTVESYKYGINYAPTDWIRARAIFNKAVRAPSADETFRSGDQGFPRYTDPCNSTRTGGNADLLAFCTTDGNISSGFVPGSFAPTFGQVNTQVQAFSFGAEDLEAEEAETITAGFVVEPDFLPVGRLRGSFDYVNIKLDNAIVTRGADTVLSSCYNNLGATPQSALDCAQIVRSPLTGQIVSVNTGLQNSAGTTEITGYDIQIDYNFDLDEVFAGAPGSFSLTNLTTITDEYLDAGDNYAGQTLGGVSGSFPDYKLYTTLGYRLDDWYFQVSHAYIPALSQSLFWYGTEEDNGVPKAPEYSNFDFAFSWNVTDSFSVSGAINNVTDELPPQTITGVLGGGQGNVDANEYAGWVVGRTYSIGAKFKF